MRHTETEIKLEGFLALTKALGMVDAERFISLIQREPFDYTLWQKNLLREKAWKSLVQRPAGIEKTEKRMMKAGELFQSLFLLILPLSAASCYASFNQSGIPKKHFVPLKPLTFSYSCIAQLLKNNFNPDFYPGMGSAWNKSK